jgi:hypothetical protein
MATKAKKLAAEAQAKREKEILDGNILLARFMGGHTNPQNRWYNVLPNQNGYILPENLLFNTDWNWLMCVVDKINKRDWVTIYCDECKIHSVLIGDFETISIVDDDDCNAKWATFKACCAYASWYLENVKE